MGALDSIMKELFRHEKEESKKVKESFLSDDPDDLFSDPKLDDLREKAAHDTMGLVNKWRRIYQQ